ncbi:MAG: hypothetical protein M1133_03045 [Armatimonadetes bacterium]|nr:hypothetical protein [Armatimonadota bacterium]
MFQTIAGILSIVAIERPALRVRACSRVLAIGIGLALFGSVAGYAEAVPGAQQDVRSFFKTIVGDWIGACEQSTDGKKAGDKYFHALITQADANTFHSQFEYYRLDEKTGSPLHIGTSTVTTTLAADGSAKNHITGKGIILVNLKPKNQQHDFTEVLKPAGMCLQGEGSGSISVSGMPLGLGKGGKIQRATSTWSLSGGVLNISQSIKAGFRALFFTKSFNVAANYTAKRGANIASLMGGSVRVSSTPASGMGQM